MPRFTTTVQRAAMRRMWALHPELASRSIEDPEAHEAYMTCCEDAREILNAEASCPRPGIDNLTTILREDF